MYKQILEGIKKRHSLESPAAVSSHLAGLQDSVKALRAAFKRAAFNALPVRFDYADIHIQEAYMLAYFPHYAELLEVVLSDAGEVRPPSKLLLFGSGPCPEIIGYLKYLKAENNLSLSVRILDSAASSWKYSHGITRKEIIPAFQNGHIIASWEAISFRINEPFTFGINEPLGEVGSTKEPHLVVCQNCLNEIDPENYETIISNFEKLYDQLAEHSLIVIIDIAHYRRVESLIARIQGKLSGKEGFKLLRNVDTCSLEGESDYRNPLPVIRENLLTGENGLKPKRKVKCKYSLIRKGR